MTDAVSGSVYVFCPGAVVQAASALGVDGAALLRDAGINTELLRVPGERIPLAQYLDFRPDLASMKDDLLEYGRRLIRELQVFE